MKATLSILLALILCGHASTAGATVELAAGPHLSVDYNSEQWRPLASLKAPQPGVSQSMTWELQGPSKVQITVTSSPEQKDRAQRKKELLLAQNFRGDAAKLVAERKEPIAGQEFQVLEFHNPNTRPDRREIDFFLPRPDGFVSLFVVADEADLPARQEAIEAFLRQIHLK